MGNIIFELLEKGVLHSNDVPSWLPLNTMSIVIMGSAAYGVSTDSSDLDLYGFTVPPKDYIFPNLRGEIQGFGTPGPTFEQWQKHHVKDPNACGGKGKEYDFHIQGIVKYFDSLRKMVPNCVDTLYVPRNCIVHSTAISEHVRHNRKIFLSKKLFHSFSGYAHQSLSKAENKKHFGLESLVALEKAWSIPHTTTLAEAETMAGESLPDSLYNCKIERDWKSLYTRSYPNLDDKPDFVTYYLLYRCMYEVGKRSERVKIEGNDWKFIYHVIRLADECEQLLESGDMDLQRAKEYLKRIRKGEITIDEIYSRFDDYEKRMRYLYENSNAIPDKPDEAAIKNLLLECLEMHYGRLDAILSIPDKAMEILRSIAQIVDGSRNLIYGV